MYRDTLHLDPTTTLTTDDDFFALGGDSLSATRVVARANSRLGTTLTLRDLFRARTIGNVADFVDNVADLSSRRHQRPQDVVLPERIPASYGQQSLWVIDRLGGPASQYVVPTMLSLVGAIDEAALSHAVTDVVARHEPLRTLLVEDRGELRQVVVDVGSISVSALVETDDLRDASQATVEARISELAHVRFDLGADLPFRSAVLRTGDTRWTLILALHHHAVDEWSIPALLRDLSTAYAARAAGDEPGWTGLPVSYAQYTLWQRSVLGDAADPGSALAGHLGYWKEALAGAPEESTVALDRPRPVNPSQRGSGTSIAVDSSVAESVKRIADELDVTMFVVAQAATAVAVATLGAGPDVVIGSPVGGRTAEGLEDLVGYFVNTLPLRHRIEPTDTVRQLILATRRVVLDGFAHQEAPFEEIARALGVERVVGRTPIFQIMLTHHRLGDDSSFAMGEHAVALPSDLESSWFDASKADLEVAFEESSNGLSLTLIHATDIFDQPTVDRFGTVLVRLLSDFGATPDAAVGSLITMPQPDLRRIEQWTHGPVIDRAGAETLSDAVRRQVDLTPHATALVDDAGIELSYSQFDMRVSEIHTALQARGVGRGDRVAVVLPRSIDLVVALHAIVRAGAAYVPIDPDYPAERVGHILADATPVVVVSDAGNAALHEFGPLGALLVDGTSAQRSVGDENTPALLPTAVTPHDTAYLIFTSGTTGRPKGVAVSHRAIMNRLTWMATDHGVGPGDRLLLKTPATFDVSVPEFFLALITGATLVVAVDQGHKDPDYLVDVMERHRITLAHFVPVMLDAFLSANPDPARLASLRRVFFSGEALPSSTAGSALAVFGEAELHNLYGPTEAAVEVTAVRISTETLTDTASVPIGSPISNTYVRVLDSWLRPVAPGVTGELYLGGVQLADGYIGRPSLTADRFVADPESVEGERLYRSGDLVRWNSVGALDYLGRSDDQVKIRGFRIELEEIRVVLERHDDVGNAVVVALDGPTGAAFLAAYYTSGSTTVDSEVVREFVAASVPDYMVPAVFMAVDRFPTTPNGKLDRRALPVPEFTGGPGGGRRAATDTEIRLAEVFRDVLRLPIDTDLFVDDDFFRLGGDSISSIQVVSAARRAGIVVTAAEVFGSRTVAALARVADARALDGTESPHIAAAADTSLWPIAAQRVGDPGFASFTQSAVFVTPRGATIDDVRSTLTMVTAHHIALRSTLTPAAGGTWTFESARVPSVEDLVRERVETERTDERWSSPAWISRARGITATLSTRLNPEAGVLWRALWCTSPGEESGRLVLVVHHLVVDGVSWRILADDLSHAWALHSGSAETHLLPVGTSVASWTRALGERAHDEDVLREMPFWAAVSEAYTPVFGDRGVDPEIHTKSRTADVSVSVSADITTGVLGRVPTTLSARIDDVLLGAVAIAIAAWRSRHGYGRSPVVIGLEGHGRQEDIVPGADLSRTLGWFTSWYPVLVDVTGTGSSEMDGLAPSDIADGVLRVKDQLAAVPNRGIGYGLLRHLNAETTRDLDSIIPDVGFNYLGRFGAADRETSWSSAPEFPGIGGYAPGDLPAPAVLDINVAAAAKIDGSSVLDGTFTYVTDILTADDAQELADLWVAALEALVHYADSSNRVRKSPSDVMARSVSLADIVTWEHRHGDLYDVQPLTPLQHGMVFESMVSTDGGAGLDVYVTQHVLHVTGELEPKRLERALGRTLDKYPNLKAAFEATESGDIVAVVPVDVSVSVTHLDLTHRSDTADKSARVKDADRVEPFDLATPPSVRVTVLTIDPGRHEIVLTMHHTLSDGWSTPSVVHSLLNEYRNPSARPTVDSSYEAFLRWLTTRDRDASAAAWSHALAAVTEPTSIAPVAISGSGSDFPDDVVLTVAESSTAQLIAVANERGATLNSALQAVWAVTLNALTGNETVVFGSTVSGRPAEVEGIETAVGMFINTVPTPVTVAGNSTLEDVIDTVQRQNASLLDHHYTPLSDLHRLTGQSVLFDTLFVYENYPIDEDAMNADSAGLVLVGVDGRDATHYPITVAVVPVGDSIRVEFSYRTDRLTESAMNTVVSVFERVLETVANHPSSRVAAIDPLSLRDRGRIELWRNGTETAGVDSDQTLVSLVRRQIETTPDGVAVVDDTGSELTYADFDRRVDAMAAVLVRSGVVRGGRVVVLLPRSVDLVVAVHAVVRVGAAYVPVDVGYPSERVGRILEDAAPVVVITDVATHRTHFEVLPVVSIVVDDPETWERLRTSDATVVNVPVTKADSAYAIFTSGTTGRPKGVVVSHGAIVNLISWRQSVFPIGVGDRVLQKTSVGFDVSVPELFWPLTVGGVVRLISAGGEKDPSYLARVLTEEPVGFVELVPTVLTAMLDSGFSVSDSQVRHLSVGGESFPVSLGRALTEPNGAVRVWNTYGPTEAAVEVTGFEVTEASLAAESAVIPIGSPVSNTSVRVFDGWLREVPVGVVGELYVGGAQVADGYIERPALTAERFVADPLGHPGARVYRTGDIVRWNDAGVLEFLGRGDDQVKIRGLRIELDEIRVVLEAHPAVSGAVVTAPTHPAGGSFLAAYYVGDVGDVESLRTFVADSVPDYMVPTVFVAVESFPRTMNGKLDVRALPVPDLTGATGAGRAPESDTERVLIQVFRDVLRIPTDAELSVDDDFFRVGGDSISSIQVVSKARRSGVTITAAEVFGMRTAARLAELVDGRAGEGAAVSAPEKHVRSPLLPIAADHIDRPEFSSFTQSIVFVTPSELSVDDARHLLTRIAEHHPALGGTVVRNDSGEWIFALPEGSTSVFDRVEGMQFDGAWSAAAWSEAIRSHTAELSNALDPTLGILWRALVVGNSEEDTGRLLVVIHHLVVDGVSWRIIGDDLAQAWAQEASGAAGELMPVGTSVTSWAHALHGRAHDADVASESNYWNVVTEEITPLFGDRGIDPVLDTVGSSGRTEVTVPAAISEVVLGKALSVLSTGIDEVLLGALTSAVSTWRARRRLEPRPVVIGVEGHGREETFVPGTDLSRTVGWFTSWYPVVVEAGSTQESDTLEAAVDAVLRAKESLAAVPNRGIGYGVLQYSNRSRGAGVSSGVVPDIGFNYLGRFDGVRAETTTCAQAWEFAPEAPGIGGYASEGLPVSAVVDINVVARTGNGDGNGDRGTVLDASFSFASGVVDAGDVRELTELWVQALTAVADYAESTDRVRTSPSDLTASGITFDDLVEWEDRHGEIDDVQPLTPVQQGMVFESLLGADTGVDMYVTQTVLHLEGALDTSRFDDATQAVVRTYPNLAAAFTTTRAGVHVAVIPSRVEVPFTHIDLVGTGTDAEIARALEDLVEQDRLRSFVLDNSPLVRMSVVSTAPDRHEAILTMHHALSDGWSTPSIVHTLLQAYRLPSRSLVRDLVYPSFLTWFSQRDAESSSARWAEVLRSVTEPTLIASAASSNIGAFPRDIVVDVDSNAVERLTAVVRATGSTLNSLVQAAWAVTLNALTGNETVVFGSTVSGRPAEVEGIETAVGMFINTVPTPVTVTGSSTLSDLVDAVQRQNTSLLDHHHTPLSDLHRLTGHSALFDTVVVYENYPVDEEALGAADALGLTLAGVDGSDSTHYPMTVGVIPRTDGSRIEKIRFEFSYRPDLLTPAMAEGIVKIFETVLDGFIAAPDTRVASLGVVSTADVADIERRSVGGKCDVHGTLDSLVRNQIRLTPDAVAVVDDLGSSLTYAEFDLRVDAMAAVLARSGVQRGDRVAVMLPRSIDLVVSVHAVIRAGAAYVPIDPQYPSERVGHILSDSAPVVVITDMAGDAMCAGLSTGTSVVVDEGTTRAILQSRTPKPIVVGKILPSDSAYVIFTSGTTGRPKGVVVSHGAIVNLIAWRQSVFPIAPGERVLQKTSIGFDVSVPELTWPLTVGGVVRLVSAGGEKDPSYLARVLTEEPVGFVELVPTVLTAMLDDGFSVADSRVKFLSVGGESFLASLGRALTSSNGVSRVWNTYGPTEAAVEVTGFEVTADSLAQDAAVVPIGSPLTNTSAWVLDRWLRQVPVGVVGELYVGGAQVADGYIGRVGLTAERFVADPNGHPGARVYRTGDVVRWTDAGQLEFVGRTDDQVKIRGFRIELDEIRVVLEGHPAVSAAVVTAATHPAGGKFLAAYHTGDAIDAEVLRSFVAGSLPDYMVPAVFARVEDFPTTVNGKLDVRALPAADLAGAVGAGRLAESETETVLAQIFREVLHLAAEVSVDDDFFRSGGDSISSIQVVSKARRAGVMITAAEVFKSRTVEALAAVVDARAGVSAAVSGPSTVDRSRLWPIAAAHVDRPGFSAFTQSYVFVTPAGLVATDVERILAAVVGHHTALSGVLIREASGSHRFQLGGRSTTVADNFFVDTCTEGWSSPEWIARVHSTVETMSRGVHPEGGKLWQATWCVDEREHTARLIMVVHHLVVDGVSWRILEDDLAHAWAQLNGSTADELLPVGTSITSWTGALEKLSSAPELAAQTDYWNAVSGSIVPLLGVRGVDPTLDTVASAGEVSVTVPTAVTELVLGKALTVLSARIDDVLLGALTSALRTWRSRRGFPSRPVVVGLEGHGREETLVPGVDLSRTIGWFTTWYPVVTYVPPAEGGADPIDAVETVLRVKESLASVPDKGIGYGVLRYLGSLDADRLADASVPDIGFNYLGHFASADATDSAGWRSAPELPGLGGFASRETPVPSAVDVNVAAVRGERGGTVFDATFSYASGIVSSVEANELAHLWVEALATIAAYVESSDRVRISPSDLTASGITFDEIAEWEKQYGDLTDVQPLTPLQQGMVFESLLGAESGVDMYVTQTVLRVTGALDANRFDAAVARLIDTYPNLAVAVTTRSDGEHVAVVPARVTVPTSYVDLSGSFESEAADALSKIVERDRSVPFVLNRAPLVRICVVTTGRDRHEIVMAMHHALADGWSTPLITSTLLDAYREPATAHRSITAYTEFLKWLGARDRAASLKVWGEALSAVDAPTLVAGGHIDRGADTFPRVVETTADARSTAQLTALARERGTTLNTVVQAAWAVVLNAVTAQRTVVFGSTVSGRPAEIDGIEDAVGLFINTIATPVTLGLGSTLSDVVASVHRRNTGLIEHHHTPLTDLHRMTGHDSLFDTLVVFESYPVDEDAMGVAGATGLTLTGVGGSDSSHYPLTVAVIPGETETRFEFSYRADMIDDASVSRIVELFARTIEAFGSTPDIAVASLNLLSIEDDVRITSWCNGNATDSVVSTLDSAVRSQIGRTPDAIAVIDDDGAVLTYADIDVHVDAMAALLLERGVGVGDRVAVLLPRSIDLVVTLLASVRIGAAYVPIDPGYPSDRIFRVLVDSTPRVVVTDEHGRAAHRGVLMDSVLVRDDRARLVSAESPSIDTLGPSPADIAYVLFTSGTTGRPKGVMVPHAAIMNLVHWLQSEFPLGVGDTVLQKTAIGFDASVPEFFWPLTVGGTIRLIRPDGERDPEYLAEILRSEPVAFAGFVPTVLQAMIDQGFDFGSSQLRYLAAGGEALPTALAKTLADSPVSVWNVYGPTETAVDVTAYRVKPGDSIPSAVVPIGSPVSNTRAHVLDGWLRPVPVGVTGELYLGGIQLARGYIGRPGLTADRFVADPYGSAGGRLYRSGDLVRWNEEGTLEFLGRADQQVKIRGFRIELDEIRAVLDTHPDVSAAVVITAQSPDGEKYLAAYYTSSGSDVGADELRAYVGQTLPSYMVPTAFIALDSFPTTANGKLDRAALPDWGPALGAGQGQALSSASEHAVAQIFREVLHLPENADLTRNDSFFELGGHSLSATRVVARANAYFDTKVTLRSLFDAPTIGGFSELVAAHNGIPAHNGILARPAPPSRSLARPSVLPVSYGQQTLWLSEQVDAANFYRTGEVLKIDGRFDADALRRAVARLIDRHEILRTTFVLGTDGDLTQVIDPHPDVESIFAAEDLGSDELPRRVESLFARAVDPSQELGLRFTALSGDEQNLLVVHGHHIVTDEQSSVPMIRDLDALYREELGGRTAQLPPLPLQYADFALRQREELGAPGDPDSQYRRELDYWKSTLGDLPDVTPLPLDADRSQIESRTIRSATIELTASDSDEVDAFIRTTNTTPLQAVIAATALALWNQGSGTSLPIGTPIDLRDDPALADLVGYFINTVVVRTDLDETAGFGSAVVSTRNSVLDAQEHKSVPFDSIVDHVVSRRVRSVTPLFQVMAVYFGDASSVSVEAADRSIVPFDAGTTASAAESDFADDALFDLVVAVEKTADGRYVLDLQAVRELFGKDTVDRVLNEIRAFLLWGSRYPELPIVALRQFAAHPAHVPPSALGSVLRVALPATSPDVELWRMAVDQIGVGVFGDQARGRLGVEIDSDILWLVGRGLARPAWIDAVAVATGQLVDAYREGIPMSVSVNVREDTAPNYSDELSALLEDPFWDEWVDNLADLDPVNTLAFGDVSVVHRAQDVVRVRMLDPVTTLGERRAAIFAAVAFACADLDEEGALVVMFADGGDDAILAAIDEDAREYVSSEDTNGLLEHLANTLDWEPRHASEYRSLSASPLHNRFFDDVPEAKVRVSVVRTDAELIEPSDEIASECMDISLWISHTADEGDVLVRIAVDVGADVIADAGDVATRLAKALSGSGIAVPDSGTEPLIEIRRSDRVALPALEIARIRDRYGRDSELLPLSPLQSGLLYHIIRARETGDNNAYISQIPYRLNGAVDSERMGRAIRVVLGRYPNVRAGFVSTADGEVQVIPASFELPYRVVSKAEWSSMFPSVDEVLAAERDVPFDHERPPLLRFALIETAVDRWTLCMTTEHILMDGWSLYALLGEVLDIYADPSYADRHEPASFRDYLDWLAARDTGVAYAAWSEYLADVSGPSIVWPGGGDLTSTQVETGEVHSDLDADTARAVHEAARSVGVTVGTVLQVAWALTLGRLLGTSDVIVGNNVSGRPPELPDAERIIGLLFNTLPFRVRFDAFESVADLLVRVQREQISVMEHSYAPLIEVQERAGVGTLFDTLFVVQNFGHDEASDADGDEFDVEFDSVDDATHYPVTFAVDPTERNGDFGVHLRMSYRRDVYDENNAREIVDRYTSVLRNMATGLSRPVAQIPTLLPHERQVISVDGDTRVVAESTVNDLLREQVSRTPEALALVAGDTTFTFSEFFTRVNRYGRMLIREGVRREHRVALLLPRDERMVVSMFAVFAVGAAYVPIDAEHPDERIEYMLDAARPTVTLVTSRDSSRLAAAGGQIIDLDNSGVLAGIDAEHGGAVTDDERGGPIEQDNLAYVIFTSGSTGRPKGVAVGYRGLTNMYVNHVAKIFDRVVAHQRGRTMRIAHTTSFAFDASWEQLFWMLNGHTVDVIDEELRREPKQLLEYYDAARIDGFDVTPSYGQLLVDSGLLDRDRPAGRSVDAASSGVVFVSLGGEAVPERLWQQLRDAPGVEAYNLYGPTEYTINALGADLADSTTSSVGTPIANTRAYILDANLQPALPGVAGELYLTGAGIARGYWGQSALTSERFPACPWERGARMYRTGDLVRRSSEGTIEYLGRADDQVKIRGYRIEPGEIADVLAEDPQLSRAAVVARRNASGVLQLHGFVVPASAGYVVDLDAVRIRARGLLPDYMMPSGLAVVDSIPLTVNGKVDTRALPEIAGSEGAYVAPDTTEELLVAEAVADLLGLDRVSTTANFFESGGNSLIAMRLIARLHRDSRSELRVKDIFSSQTIGAIAQLLEQDEREIPTAEAILVPLRDGASDRTLFCIHEYNGFATIYSKIVHGIPDQWAVVGMQEPIHGGSRVVIDDFDELCGVYADAVVLQQPTGPYDILGWSYGGHLAFGVARILVERGHHVATLTILDAVPTSDGPLSDDDSNLPDGATGVDIVESHELADRFMERIAQMEGKFENLVEGLFVTLNEGQRRALATAGMRAEVMQLQPTRGSFAGRTLLVAASSDMNSDYSRELAGMWRPFTPNLEVVDVDSTHTGILVEAASEVWLPVLRQHLYGREVKETESSTQGENS
nr:non-ribosomal peptide synthase/polyketide synthase [Rhodococcus sp. 15-1154-1]